MAAAARALAVVAEVVGAGCIRIRPRGAGMSSRMGSLGSLVDRLHFPLRGRKQQAYLQLLPSFPSHNQTGRMRRSRMEQSLPQ